MYVGTAAIIMVTVEAGLIVLMDSDHWVTLWRKKTFLKGRGLRKSMFKRSKNELRKGSRTSARLNRVANKYLAVQKLVYLSSQPKPEITVIYE